MSSGSPMTCQADAGPAGARVGMNISAEMATIAAAMTAAGWIRESAARSRSAVPGIEVMSQLRSAVSTPARAPRSAVTAPAPMTVDSANDVETAAVPPAMRIARPGFFTLARGAGTRPETLVRAPARTIRRFGTDGIRIRRRGRRLGRVSAVGRRSSARKAPTGALVVSLVSARQTGGCPVAAARSRRRRISTIWAAEVWLRIRRAEGVPSDERAISAATSRFSRSSASTGSGRAG